MLIGCNNVGLGMYAFIKEPVINREASNYIMNNYKNLIDIIKKSDIKEEKAQDLLHDVYISVVEAEENGNGFDMEFGSRMESDGTVDFNLMDVSQFVIGRIKLYAKNTKYRTDCVESSSSYVKETSAHYVSEWDKNGQEIMGKDGKPKLVKKIEKRRVPIMVTSNAASFTDGGDVEENNDEFQRAFALAHTADSTDDITELMSIREQIDYCIDICSLNGVNILNILKNIDMIAEMLGDYSRKKKTSEGIFSKITELVQYHSELAENLMEIIKFSGRNKEAFEAIIATY